MNRNVLIGFALIVGAVIIVLLAVVSNTQLAGSVEATASAIAAIPTETATSTATATFAATPTGTPTGTPMPTATPRRATATLEDAITPTREGRVTVGATELPAPLVLTGTARALGLTETAIAITQNLATFNAIEYTLTAVGVENTTRTSIPVTATHAAQSVSPTAAVTLIPTHTPDVIATSVHATVAAQNTPIPAQTPPIEVSGSSGDDPTPVAVVPFTVRDISGQRVGSGEVAVYGPESIRSDQIAEIRAQIITRERSISYAGPLPELPTPTPNLDPQPTATPLPQIARRFTEIWEIMGIGLRGLDLDHFEVQYSGQPDGIAYMRDNAAPQWRWTLRPKGAEAVGKNALELYVYRPGVRENRLDIYLETDTIPIELEVLATPNDALLPLIAVGSIGVLIAVVIGFGVIRYRRSRQRSAFLSYRRQDSAQLVQAIAEKLRRNGIRPYFDTESIDSAGRFPERLLAAIQQADVFVCLLGATTLESDWVLREIEHAYKVGKLMIPVFQERYQASDNPPMYVQAMLDYDGLSVLDVKNEYLDQAVEKLARMIRKAKR
ncbi:MAG: hypothetical protein OHK0023_22830 [Anaerolineae bacterium]